MCPIEISSGVPYYISDTPKTLRSAEPTTQTVVVVGTKYIVRADKGDDCIVKVYGYPKLPGGTITSTRFTPDESEDCFFLTTEGDPTLPMSGLFGANVDSIQYTGVDVLPGT